jgi:hypothetical protein
MTDEDEYKIARHLITAIAIVLIAMIGAVMTCAMDSRAKRMKCIEGGASPTECTFGP